MKPFFILLIVFGASLHSNAIAAQNSSKLRADRIQISYVPPKDAAHEPVFRLLKERQVLEQFRELLSSFAPAARASIESRRMRRGIQRLV